MKSENPEPELTLSCIQKGSGGEEGKREGSGLGSGMPAWAHQGDLGQWPLAPRDTLALGQAEEGRAEADGGPYRESLSTAAVASSTKLLRMPGSSRSLFSSPSFTEG